MKLSTLQLKLKTKNCSSQCFDGATIMCVKISSIQSRIKEIVPHAI